jgi:hypothetical protein
MATGRRVVSIGRGTLPPRSGTTYIHTHVGASWWEYEPNEDLSGQDASGAEYFLIARAIIVFRRLLGTIVCSLSAYRPEYPPARLVCT